MTGRYTVMLLDIVGVLTGLVCVAALAAAIAGAPTLVPAAVLLSIMLGSMTAGSVLRLLQEIANRENV